MNQVDAILAGHTASITESGPDFSETLPRYPRAPHAEIVRQLTEVNGWWTSVVIATQWSSIIGSLVVAAYYPYWWVFVICGVVIATRMQALGVLLHDATHYLLYKNRVVNDVVSDLTLAFPLGMSTTLYRRTHFRHHRFTNSEQDQDLVAQREEGEWYEWPKSKLGLTWALARSVFGVNAHKAWILYTYWAPWHSLFKPIDSDFPLRARVLYLLSAAGIYSLIGWGISVDWKLTATLCALYAIPSLTLLNLINRVRATAEHVGTERTHELNSTRSIVPRWYERLTIAPFNVSYHLEHHLFPSVPGYNLQRLHRHLMEDPEFRDQAHVTQSYAGFFHEVMSLSSEDRPDVVVAEQATASDP